jgi:hypothetical protein
MAREQAQNEVSGGELPDQTANWSALVRFTDGLPVYPVAERDLVMHGKLFIRACSQRWTESTEISNGSYVY